MKPATQAGKAVRGTSKASILANLTNMDSRLEYIDDIRQQMAQIINDTEFVSTDD